MHSLLQRTTFGFALLVVAAAACTTTETIYVNQLVYPDATATTPEDSTAPIAIDAASPIPAGCIELVATKVENGTMFASGAKYGRWGTRLRLTLAGSSPFPELPSAGAFLALDHPVARPSAGTPVVLPIGNGAADLRTSVHYGLAYYDSADGNTTAYFASSAGRLTLTDVVNDEQLAGSADGVRFDEVEFSEEGNGFNSTRRLTSPRCLYLRHVDFDTRVANGCDPDSTLSCGAGKTCKAINRAASDGVCVASGGTLADGAPCTEDPVTGASGCAQGSVCSKTGSDFEFGPRCLKRCDQYSSLPQCSNGFVCDRYSVCVPPTETSEGNRHHPEIPLWGDCGSFSGIEDAQSTTCGGSQGAAGKCLDVDADGNQRSARCLPFVRGRQDCFKMGMSPGSTGGSGDYSRIFCFEGFAAKWPSPVAPDASAPSDGGDAQ